MYATTRRRASCRCCGGCTGCQYACLIVFSGAAVSGVAYRVTFSDGTSFTFTDDLPDDGHPRAYWFGLTSPCSTVITALTTEFGASYFEEVSTGAFGADTTDCDKGVTGAELSSHHTSTGTPPADLPSGVAYRVYQTCDRGTSLPCTKIAAGPVTECNPIIAYNMTCCCNDTVPGNYIVITGTGSVCMASTNVAGSGTGNVSSSNYFSWDAVGADGVNAGTSFSGATTGGIGFTATLLGAGHFERRNSQFPSYSGDFTPGEPLLFAESDDNFSYPGDTQIDFDRPVQASGARFEQNTATLIDDFFIKAYLGGVEVSYTPPGSNTGLFIDASVPGANSTPFYGISGTNTATAFDRLVIGLSGSVLSGAGTPYAISTLEVLACKPSP